MIKDKIFYCIFNRLFFDIGYQNLYNNKLLNNWFTLLSAIFLNVSNSILTVFNLSKFNVCIIYSISKKFFFIILNIFIRQFFDRIFILNIRNIKIQYIAKQPLYHCNINLIYFSKFIFCNTVRLYTVVSISTTIFTSPFLSSMLFSIYCRSLSPIENKVEKV